ncbi:MAG: transketolase family protein, partial [Terriglobia bacterium]
LTWGQIRVSVCYSDANVKVVASHTGITTGEDGASHQATEDIAIMRSLPGMVVLVPCDHEQTKRATEAASAYQGPVYIRFGREKVASMTTAETPFEVGKAQLFREGSDVTIVACGIMVYESMVAAESLATEGISAQVVNCHTVKPLDKSMIVEAVAKTGAVVTAEEHQLDGGLGGAVAEAVSTEIAVPVEMVGVDNTFGESGKPAELMKKYGITAENVVAAAKAAIARKKP